MEKQVIYVQSKPETTLYRKYEFDTTPLKRGVLPSLERITSEQKTRMIEESAASRGDFLYLPDMPAEELGHSQVSVVMTRITRCVEDVLSSVIEQVDPNMGSRKWSNFSKRTARNLMYIFRQYGFEAWTHCSELKDYGIKHWYSVRVKLEDSEGQQLYFLYDPLWGWLANTMRDSHMNFRYPRFVEFDATGKMLPRNKVMELHWYSVPKEEEVS